MQNPMMSQLNQPMINQILSRAKEIQSAVQGTKNPQATLQMMLNKNPKAQELLNQYGTPEKAVKARAAELGIDPNMIINALKG